MKVIITIPAYNEEKTITPVIKELKDLMRGLPYEFEILVVNDGSEDKTVKVAENAGAIVYSNKKNLGLADTFKHEMKRCKEHNADIIVHTDADGQYPAKYIPPMIEKIIAGADLVLGCRFEKGQYSGSKMKSMGNKMFARAFSKLLKTKLTDTTTGFRAFTREVAELPLINSFTYTQEQLIRAGKANMKIEEIPITTRETRPSKLFNNPFEYAIKAWINILRIYRDFEPLKFFGRIGITLIVLGGILGLYILGRIIVLGTAGGIPRVVLSALLILTGIQIISFGFLADMQRK